MYGHSVSGSQMEKYLLLLLCFASFSSTAGNDKFISAKVIENFNSKGVNETYNRSRVEGWAYLSFVVNTEGQASNIVAINSSSDRSIDQAKMYLENLRYSSAMANNEAVNEAKTIFFTENKQVESSGKGAISKGFINRYNEAYKVVTSKNKELAKEKLKNLTDTYTKNFEEQALSHWLHSIHYFLHAEWGLYFESLEKGYLLGSNLPRDIEVKNTKNLLDWYIFKKSYPQALKVLARLNNIKERKLSPESFNIKYNEIISGQKNNKTINTEFVMYGRRNSWLQELSHSSISFESSNSDLSIVELRCQNAVYKFAQSSIENFQIPDDYIGCSILVQAPLGTSFTLIEQDKSTNDHSSAEVI